jgi:hypothetical protein
MSKYLINDKNFNNDYSKYDNESNISKNKEIDKFQLEQANLNFKKIMYIIEH